MTGALLTEFVVRTGMNSSRYVFDIFSEKERIHNIHYRQEDDYLLTRVKWNLIIDYTMAIDHFRYIKILT